MNTDSGSSDNSSDNPCEPSCPYVLEGSHDSEEEDDYPNRIRRKRFYRRRVSSSDSDSCMFPPRKKIKAAICESESDFYGSSESDIDEVFKPWRTDRRKPASRLSSESESSDEEIKTLNRKENVVNQIDDHSSDSDNGEKCIICFKSLRGIVAQPSGCSHSFHSECILTWSKTSNTCPIDRVKYIQVIVSDSNGELTRHDVITPPPQDHNNDIEPEDTTFCEVCNQHDREHEMLLCDRCESGYHLDCLTPPLVEVPIGDWFCPDCTSAQNDIDPEEVSDLLRTGAILIGNRLRDRPESARPPRVGPRTRAAQRVISNIRAMADQNELIQPSTSTNRQTQRRKRRRRSTNLNRRTHYKVELITAEDGSTIEVKVAVNRRRGRRVKKKSARKSRKKGNHTFKLVSSKNNETTGNTRSSMQDIGLRPLDIFGSRPQLEYFSGCEAEDELDEEGGGGLNMLRVRSSGIRSMAGRKQLAAQVFRSAPRRPVPRIGLATAPPDLLSSILDEQAKWHSPNALIQSNSNGEVQVTLQADNVPVRKNVGSEEKANGTTNGQTLQKEENSQSNEKSSESVPPLQPPPQPIFSRGYDDEDFDLYADIETPNEPPLVPPPEPPAFLLAMEGDDGASSPEDTMLVIDDRQTYDPDVPTSPPPSPDKPNDKKTEKDTSKRPVGDRLSIDVNNIQISSMRIPSPNNEDDIDDCPNRVMYSEASVNIARETKSDSDSDQESNELNINALPRINIDTGQNFEPIKDDLENISDNDVNIVDDDKEEIIVSVENTSSVDEIKMKSPGRNDNNDPENCDEKEKSDSTTIESDMTNHNSKESDKYEQDTSDEEELSVKESSNEIHSTENRPEEENLENKKSIDSESEDVNIDLEKVSDEDDNSSCNEESFSPISMSAGGTLINIDKGAEQIENLDNINILGNSEDKQNCDDKCENDWSTESTPEKKVISEKDIEGEDVLELGCGDDERDGLVDITDEEISTYEKSWELEGNHAPPDASIGLEGLETEAISDCEYNLAEDGQIVTKTNVENGPKEEGEIISEERRAPVAWKKISKSTKERSYREKDATNFKEKSKKKDKEKKPKEKRKEIERYDVRKIISDKPKKRKVDEFGRDISPSRSRSLSDSRSRSLSRRRSSSRSKRRRSRDIRSRNRSRGRSKAKSKEKVRKKSRGRSLSRSRSASRRKRSRSPRKNKERRSRAKSKEKKRRKRDSSVSCSSCSCSSCEQEKRKNKKLTVIVPNKPLIGVSGKDKKKGKYKDRSDNKRRRVDSPAPSKEVFTSGDNILVSVNFKSSKSGETSRKEPSKKKKEEEIKKKKDKGSKENQPIRSIVSKSNNNQQPQKKSKINAKNLKPVAIIDLAQSPFREQTLSPKEVIVLTDSDSDDKRKLDDAAILTCQVTGPKTPPEPHIKFNIVSSKPQMLRSLVNPLLDSSDQLEGDGDEEEEDERVDIPHKGPNTPPEPPVPYDPFEPTKSRSPTPMLQELEENRNPTPPIEKNLPSEPSQRSISPPKPQPESPKTPSPLHSPPPKPQEELIPEKTLSPSDNCDDDSIDIGVGDSPYSPGSSDADGSFDAQIPQLNPSTPVAKVKPRQIQQKHSQKHTPSPLKKKTANKSSTTLKNSKGNKKESASAKLDEDQLKILDDLPNSAVEMQVKDKVSPMFLKKLNRQERVVEEVKMVLKPHYAKKHVTKEEYKEILRKSVPKICHSRSGEINPIKIQRLIEAYVKKYRHQKKKRKPTFSAPESLQPLKPKQKQNMWC